MGTCSPIYELKSLWLYASQMYFPDRKINSSITSVRSKHNTSFLKLQKILEEEDIDADSYIGFIFQTAETRPTPSSLSSEKNLLWYKHNFGLE
jgi:hypothetical protein